MKNQRMKKERGITLVALVITIVILIILATISIDAIWGQSGLFKQAQQTKESAENSVISSEEDLNAISQEYANMLAEDTELPEEPPKTVAEAKPEEGEDIYYFEDTTKITDDSGDPIWIPGDFGVTEDSATEIDEGVVITDGTNEFVWIPVDSTSLAEMYNTSAPNTPLSKSSLNETTTTTNVYSKLRIRTGDSYTAGAPGSTNLREPDILTSTASGDAVQNNDARGINLIKSTFGYTDSTDAGVLKHFAQDMVNEYTATYKSIAKYGGFYIGRYELTETEGKPTVQRNQPVLTGANENYTTWYGLKKACSEVVTNHRYAQSEMIYGNQWDEVMDWLKQTEFVDDPTLVDNNSTSWGNYNNSSGNAEIEGAGSPQESGFSDYWSANNIYDLAGNYFDFTQEATSTAGRIYRRWQLCQFRFCLSSFWAQQ